ncbi:MAG: methionine--tRNA ligase [Rickettsiales bacterium]|jgi:methionyl-tRNA synthetase|nr:methionine--tRNA ligase [Rickettsiales bacterium]
MTKKKYLITSALPYVNNIPHIGNFVGSVLPSDVYARFCRARFGSENVLFVCGADAHGSPIVIQAKKEGVSPAELVAKYHALHAKIFQDFDISFDGGYGTTHTELQVNLVHDLFSALDKNGFIEEKTTIQPFSVDDNIFLADRQIEGTCPKCGYNKARGDQCDKCGELLDPADLINPYAADSGSRNIEMRETKNLFYRADKVKDSVSAWVFKTAEKNKWSRSAFAATKKYLSEDVPNPSVSRDLPWGIPVNKPGYEDKVFYVWFDAPWGYVSISQAAKPGRAAANGEGGWADWWHGGENCHYAQFMGKDNIKFHSLFFPGQEIAWADGNWKKVDLLKGMNFLNFEGNKISKSMGNGIDLSQALTAAPADCWRYALIASAPETDDTDFTVRRFADIVNKDLNGMLGNFVSRVAKLTEKNFGLTVPTFQKGFETPIETMNAHLADLSAALEACEFRKSIEALRSMWAVANEYMTSKAPWTLVKNGEMIAAGAVLNECFQMIDFFARVSAPFIPGAAEKIQNIFPARHDLSWPTEYEWRIQDGEEFTVPENLFERIDDARVAQLTEKYSSKPTDALKIVIAKILTATPHPTREGLSVLSVDAGDAAPLQIVCGAPNVRAGFIGVLAHVGATLPGQKKPLAKRAVAGVESHGMMCSAAELGVGADDDNILELGADSKIGEEFKK